MAPAARVLQKAIGSARPTPSNSRLCGFYSADGRALTFRNREALYELVTDPQARSLVKSGEEGVQYPVSVALNMPYAIELGPQDTLPVRVQVALVFQLDGLQGTLTRCDDRLEPWAPTDVEKTHRCLSSHFFARVPVSGGSLAPVARAFGQALENGRLDNVALFPSPYLVAFGWKESTVEQDRRSGQAMEHQKFFAFQSCTNCAAAGTLRMCTHSVVASGLKVEGVASFGERRVRRGEQSDLDRAYPNNNNEIIQWWQGLDLITVSDDTWTE